MIHLSGITKRQGQKTLYANASFLVKSEDRIGLVGPNGAGKTTIFRLIMGEDSPDAGSISILPQTRIGYFSQDVGDMKGHSALQEVLKGAGRVSELAETISNIESILASGDAEKLSAEDLSKLMDQYGDAQAEFQNLGGYDLESRAQAILTGLGIDPQDHHKPVEQFSGGWKMRIALAKILALNPQVLLLDEPTNHLDIESILWLEEWLKSFKGAIVLISHDREFMNRLVRKIVEIAHGQISSYTGNYEFYLRERDLRREQQLAAFRRQEEMLAKEEEFIAKFAARASHAAQVQSRVKKLEKIERLEAPPETKTIDFSFSTPPRSGNDVVRMENLGKVWLQEDGRQKRIFSGITGVIQRLQKIAVTGVNGAGKSTLLKTIVGITEPTEGAVTIGASVKIGYFGQHALDQLNSGKTIIDEVSEKLPNLSTGYVRNLLGAFLFSGDDIDKKISVLSGGEKARVVLAILLASPVNFLVLDEPTNHLDIESRETLLKAVQDFEGTVMIVSHDRHFLKSVVDRVVEIRNGHIRFYEGPYDHYLEEQEKI